jgi:hypothetical protein
MTVPPADHLRPLVPELVLLDEQREFPAHENGLRRRMIQGKGEPPLVLEPAQRVGSEHSDQAFSVFGEKPDTRPVESDALQRVFHCLPAQGIDVLRFGESVDFGQQLCQPG